MGSSVLGRAPAPRGSGQAVRGACAAETLPGGLPHAPVQTWNCYVCPCCFCCLLPLGTTGFLLGWAGAGLMICRLTGLPCAPSLGEASDPRVVAAAGAGVGEAVRAGFG